MLTNGSLFTGIGGFDLGFEWAGIKTIWQVEIDEYCRRLLELRFPGARRYADIRDFSASLGHREGRTESDGQGAVAGESGVPRVDILSGGFPCQPVSHAGKRQGANDARYLWPEMFRVVRTLRPKWVVAENVYGLITHEGGELLDKVYDDLEGEGYETLPPIVLPACAFGAPHRRDRVWIVAHAGHDHRSAELGQQQGERAEGIDRSCAAWIECPEGCGEFWCRIHELHAFECECPEIEEWKTDPYASGYVGDTASGRCEEQRNAISAGSARPGAECSDWWATEPAVGRVAHGIPRRVDRLRGLGNAIVPHVAYLIGRLILEYEENNPCKPNK